MILRPLVVLSVLITFVRHMQGAGSSFSQVKGERPSARLNLIPIAMIVILYESIKVPLNTRLVIPGWIGFALSLALFESARRAIRGKFFSYAFSNDIPEFLCTSGPYRHIRNPFYTSYMIAYVSAVIMLPTLGTLLVLASMIVFFARLARFEERKFENSPVAMEYKAYRQTTGRFIPGIGK